jgi:hypothetical protein
MTFYVSGSSGSHSTGGSYVVAGSSGSGSSQSGSYSAAMTSDGGYGLDECGAATLIQHSMEGHDYAKIQGVENVEFKGTPDCPDVVASKAAVVEDSELSAGALAGIALAAAALVALALLIARKMRNKDEREQFSLASDLDDFMGAGGDPYASTIDVHKCTSMYCNCNKGLENVSFIPAPKKVNLAQTMAAAGVAGAATAEKGEWYPEARIGDADTVATGIPPPPPLAPHPDDAYSVGQRTASIPPPPPMAPHPDDSRSYLPVQHRPLRAVSEIPHDSEIDTENEDNDDATSVPPPPPPVAFPPASSRYRYNQMDDEMSI